MVAVWTSRTTAALRRVAGDLEGAAWPPHPVTNETPTVGVGDSTNPKPNEAEVGEFVDVVPRVEDDAAIDWTRVTGRDESFLIEVYARTSVPNTSRDAVLDRIDQLLEVIQGMYFAWANGRLVFTPPDFPGVAPLGGVVRVTPQTFRTVDGWAGDCIVTFRIHARLDQEVAS